jgi:DNA-binding beta-propeller fold protein YncE
VLRQLICSAGFAVSLLSGCSEDATTPSSDAHPSIVTIAGDNSEIAGFADGDATKDARFNWPEGLVLDASGETLFIADSINHAIRKLDIRTNQVTTLAGVGAEPGATDSLDDKGNRTKARFNTPRNLVMSADARSLYVTDTGNFAIRRIDLNTGDVVTILGQLGEPGTADGIGSSARFGNESPFLPWSGGMAIDASDPRNEIMYIADSANQTIRAANLATLEVTTIAGQVGQIGFADGKGSTALFNKPAGVVIANGRLIVTEANNLTVRAIDLKTYEVTTVAGKAPKNPNHFCENISLELPPECDWIDAAKGTDARFRFPFGATSDGDNGMFFADSHNNVIRHLDVQNTSVTTVAGVQREVLDDIPHPSTESSKTEPGTFWHPTHVAFHPPNILYVSDRSANCVRRVELLEP